MADRIFIQKDRLTLRGDERDIMLPAQYRPAVLKWCRRNRIQIECPLNKDNEHIARHYFGVNLWRIRDEQQRMWFMLKWS